MKRAVLAWLCVVIGCGSGQGDAVSPLGPNGSVATTSTAAPGLATQRVPAKYERLSLTLRRRMGDGKDITVFEHSGAVADFALEPISLLIEGEPQTEAGKAPSAAVGGLSGALGGLAVTPRKPKPRLIGMHLQATLTVKGKTHGSAKTESKCGQPSTCVVREWLVLRLEGKDAPRTVERVLFDVPKGSKAYPYGYRRYVLTVLPGEVTSAELDARIAKVSIDSKQARKDLRKLGRSEGKERVAAIAKLRSMDPGATVGQLINLRFAALSDRTTANLAIIGGVRVVRPVPRLLITSFESSSPKKTIVSLDLRLDEVHTVNAKGEGVKLPRFHLARGLANAHLEGSVLRKLTGKEVVTTGAVMQAAQKKKVTLKLLTADNKSDLSAIALPPSAKALVEATLAAGRHVVIPEKAVRVASAKRFGWWDIDPVSGRLIGVMDNGQHQAMASYSTTTDAVVTNDATAFVLGLQAGSTATLFAIATVALQRGRVDASIVDDVKKLIENTACSVCPTVGVGASISVSLGDCFSLDLASTGKSVGSFCEAYQKGFACASGSLLAGLAGTPLTPGGGASATITVGCASVGI